MGLLLFHVTGIGGSFGTFFVGFHRVSLVAVHIVRKRVIVFLFLAFRGLLGFGGFPDYTKFCKFRL